MSKYTTNFEEGSREEFSKSIQFNNLLKELLWYEYKFRRLQTNRKAAELDFQTNLLQQRLIHWDLATTNPLRYKIEVGNPHGF